MGTFLLPPAWFKLPEWNSNEENAPKVLGKRTIPARNGNNSKKIAVKNPEVPKRNQEAEYLTQHSEKAPSEPISVARLKPIPFAEKISPTKQNLHDPEPLADVPEDDSGFISLQESRDDEHGGDELLADEKDLSNVSMTDDDEYASPQQQDELLTPSSLPPLTNLNERSPPRDTFPKAAVPIPSMTNPLLNLATPTSPQRNTSKNPSPTSFYSPPTVISPKKTNPALSPFMPITPLTSANHQKSAAPNLQSPRRVEEQVPISTQAPDVNGPSHINDEPEGEESESPTKNLQKLDSNSTEADASPDVSYSGSPTPEGQDWEDVLFIEGLGAARYSVTSEFTDFFPKRDVNYFRIRK